MIALTRSIAIEYGSYGIRCNCVCPDIIDTPLARTDRDNWEAHGGDAPGRYPVGRIGQPEDVASMIAHLAVPGAAWVSGVVVDVDGGFGAGSSSAVRRWPPPEQRARSLSVRLPTPEQVVGHERRREQRAGELDDAGR